MVPDSQPAPPINVSTPVSTSSSDLAVQNNKNESNSAATVNNSLVNVQSMNAPNARVGDIEYQGPHAFVTGYFNEGTWGTFVGIQVPLGGGKIRIAASKLAQVKVDSARLSTCAAVGNSGMSVEAATAISPDYAVCVKAKTQDDRQKASDDRDRVIDELKADLARIRAELDAARLARQTVPVPSIPVPGLW